MGCQYHENLLFRNQIFFINVLRRKWQLFDILRAQIRSGAEKKLPCVLAKSEIDRILKHVRTLHNRVFLTSVYSCGLRLQEALHLQVSDIDSQRMMIHVHRGKQAKSLSCACRRDRYVPLPEETLLLLRKYWATHRDQLLIFPALGRNGKQASTATSPMAIASVQKAVYATVSFNTVGWGEERTPTIMVDNATVNQYSYAAGMERNFVRILKLNV